MLPATPPSCPLTPRTRTLHMGRAQLSFDHCTAYLWVSLTSPVTPLSSAKQVFTEAGGDGERKDGRKVERRKEGKKERRKEGKKERRMLSVRGNPAARPGMSSCGRSLGQTFAKHHTNLYLL